jgi:hypothetical protein
VPEARVPPALPAYRSVSDSQRSPSNGTTGRTPSSATDDVAAELDRATLKPGAVAQNIGDVEMRRINEAPAIEAHIVPSLEPAGGMGEPGASAIANAIFAATRKQP